MYFEYSVVRENRSRGVLRLKDANLPDESKIFSAVLFKGQDERALRALEQCIKKCYNIFSQRMINYSFLFITNI